MYNIYFNMSISKAGVTKVESKNSAIILGLMECNYSLKFQTEV